MQPGKQPGDATWRIRIKAIKAHHQRTALVEVMWDLRKCFEHVPHDQLLRQASKQRYPMDLLRVSIHSYRWPRSIVSDYNIVAEAIHPSRGIVAGSAFATVELAVYLIEALRELVIGHPRTTISMYVDDLSMDTEGPTAEAASRSAAEVA